MEVFLQIIVVSLTFAIGFTYGWFVRERIAKNAVERMLDEMETEAEQKLQNLIPISIEKHGDMYFVYDLKDKSFMAQGENRWQLEKNLEARYPGKKFAATNENLKEVGFANDANIE